MSERTYNVLLLGETGVGKSTFINACANYAVFPSLEDAENGELTPLIPTKSTTYDVNKVAHTVSFGNDANEVLENGKSATQRCKSYEFATPYGTIRIIDTPGVGDVRGLEQDRKNFEDLFSFISQTHEIHRICILLQANCCRRTVIFDFCIKQLFAHLSKTAKSNICFVFTKARASDYGPGDTYPMLKQVLQEVAATPPHVRIPLQPDNLFSVDNESFTYVLGVKQGVRYSPSLKERYRESWNNAVKEYSRFFEFVFSCNEPHRVVDTISVFRARKIISLLTRPLAEVSQLLQDNLTVLKNQERLINSYQNDIQQLQNELYIPVIEANVIELPYPRTICVSTTCADIVQLGSIQKYNYRKKCHARCYLQNVDRERINNADLLHCAAMNGGTTCQICGCSYMKHMHVYYEMAEDHKKIVDQSRQKQIKTKEDAKMASQEKIKQLLSRAAELRHEESCIIESCAKFANYLKNNAITPYNDSFEEYLKHLIENRRLLCEQQQGSLETVQNLENMMKKYQEEKRVFERAMNTQVGISDITPAIIEQSVRKLYTLKNFGSVIKASVEKQQVARGREALEQKNVKFQRSLNGHLFLNQKFQNAMAIRGRPSFSFSLFSRK